MSLYGMRAAREAAPWVERTARIGYAAIGVVYILIGLMTAAAAAGVGGRVATWNDALKQLNGLPLGRVLLLVVAVGLTGYSLWLISSAMTDGDARGRSAKALARRTGDFGSGLIHAAIAWKVAGFALTQSINSSGGDAQAQHWTARVMQKPFGIWLVAIVGLSLIGYGIYAIVAAARGKLSSHVHIDGVAGRDLLIAVCRFGIAARGILFGVIGGSLIAAFRHRDPAHAHAMKGALVRVATEPYGRALLAIVSLGLAAYGVYALVKARYRTIRAT